MDELNEEELKGAKGGACKHEQGSYNTIILNSKASDIMWLEAGKSVKEIWIKSIFYRGQKLPIHSWMQKPLGRTDVWQYYPDGQHGKYARLRYRKNGIIIFQRYDKRIQSIQLCYYFESNGVRYKNICKATPVFEF